MSEQADKAFRVYIEALEIRSKACHAYFDAAYAYDEANIKVMRAWADVTDARRGEGP